MSQPSWSGTFIVLERRELKDKSGEVFKRLFKLGFMGGAFEVSADMEAWNSVAEGQTVDAKGTFDMNYRGQLDMVPVSIKAVKA